MDTITNFAAGFGPEVLRLYKYWSPFFDGKVRFNRPDSLIHAAGHCRRVLLHALAVGLDTFGNDPEALEILAQAAVFHDTRRLDEGYDKGHGARAAVYYKEYCREHPDITYHPETVFLVRFHDLDDEKGIEAIRKEFGAKAPRVEKLFAVFKDADALDRPRLGPHGLDPIFLRTPKAHALVDFAKKLIHETIDPDAYRQVSSEVAAVMDRFPKMLLIIGGTRPADALATYIRQTDGQFTLRVVTAEVREPLLSALGNTSGKTVFITKETDSAEVIDRLIKEHRITRIDICGLTAADCAARTLQNGKNRYPDIQWRLLTPFSNP